MRAWTDVWVPVIGYEGSYSINELGVIRYVGPRKWSCITPDGSKRTYIGRSGYPCVTLSRNGKNRSFQVHALVADAFLVKPKGTYQVDHIDGDTANYAASNLRWVTQSENQLNRHKVVAASGVTGVHELKGKRFHRKPWMACGKLHGKAIHLGTFATKEAAIGARYQWEQSVGAKTIINTGALNDQ